MPVISSSYYPFSIDSSASLLYSVNTCYDFVTNSLASTWSDSGDGTQRMFIGGSYNIWPSSSYVSVDNEILFYSFKTSVTTNSLHIPSGGRGCFNTTIVAHDSFSRVEQRIIAEYHNRLADTIVSMQNTIGSYPSGFKTGCPQTSIPSRSNYINSGTIGKIGSGTLEQRVNFLEWAMLEMVASGGNWTTPMTDGNDLQRGSRALRSASWYGNVV